MTQISADIGQLETLRVDFQRKADEIQGIASGLRAGLDGTRWEGAGAERFRAQWHEEYEPVLGHLHSALIEAATELARTRDRLIQAGA